MGVSLLRLSSGRVSLEFASSDIDRVRATILETYGAPAVKRWPAATSYSFGGVELIFQNEWDDPCLISRDAAGDAILEDLANRLPQTSA